LTFIDCASFLSNVKTASVREIQHHLSRVLEWVEGGEEVEVTRRKKVVARIVPAEDPEKKRPEWPDFEARWKEDFPNGCPGKPLSEIVDEGRGPRP